VINIHVYVRFL